jgi:hypothetical protein
MSLIQDQYGQMQSQDRLPFQQINPNSGFQQDQSDVLFQQRINERNNLDVAYGGNPMHQPSNGMMPEQPQQGMIPGQGPTQSRGGVNVHPATIHRFLDMDPAAQQRLAQSNPQFVQQIMNTIARQQSQLQPQVQLQPQSQLQPQPQPQSQAQNRNRNRQGRCDAVSDSSSSGSGDESSELENSHSSEGERPASSSKKNKMNKAKKKTQKRPERELRVSHSTETNQNVQVQGQNLFLSLDFRNDLSEINNDCYVLSFPMQHNVTRLELESCLVNRNQMLEREPYIYISIEEIPGDYQVNSGHQTHNVFGKLIQEKTVNEFIVYKPENCIKVLARPSRVDRLSIMFLRYDMTPVPLNRLPVERLSRSKDYLKVTTKAPHYLSVGDRVNISQSLDDQVSVDMVDVIKVIKPDIIALDNPVNKIGGGSSLQFEKVDLKCTLTFRLMNKL